MEQKIDKNITCHNWNVGIKTFTGDWVDINNLKEESLHIEDIAHALSMLPRYNGHVDTFYSVAHHSMFVSSLLPQKLKLAGLLHDASEAYLADIPAPFKRYIEGYKVIENRLMKVIARKFNFDYPLSKAIKIADKYALQVEWLAFMKDETIENHKAKKEEALNIIYTAFNSTYNNAEKFFIKKYNILK